LSEPVRSQYSVLTEIQKVDEKVHRLEKELERIPHEVEKITRILQGHSADHQSKKEKLAELEKNLRRAEQELKEKEDLLRKAEGKMMEVRSNEAYQAALRENEIRKTEKSALEDKAIAILTSSEEEKKQLGVLEKEYEASDATLQLNRKNLEAEQSSFLNEMEVCLQTRNELMSRLNDELLTTYRRIRARIKGSVVVRASGGMCEGCNVRLRPQLFNEIIGFKLIHRCPNCGRLLMPPVEEPEPSPGESK